MQEQLPTPAVELILLNLYLGSVSYFLAIVILFFVCRAHKFHWRIFALMSTLSLLLGLLGSFVLWPLGEKTGIDIMFGPFHLPTLTSLLVIVPLFLLYKCKRAGI